jgi:hypothetical protein
MKIELVPIEWQKNSHFNLTGESYSFSVGDLRFFHRKNEKTGEYTLDDTRRVFDSELTFSSFEEMNEYVKNVMLDEISMYAYIIKE